MTLHYVSYLLTLLVLYSVSYYVTNVKCHVKLAFFQSLNPFELHKNIFTGNCHMGILSMEKD